LREWQRSGGKLLGQLPVRRSRYPVNVRFYLFLNFFRNIRWGTCRGLANSTHRIIIQTKTMRVIRVPRSGDMIVGLHFLLLPSAESQVTTNLASIKVEQAGQKCNLGLRVNCFINVLKFLDLRSFAI